MMRQNRVHGHRTAQGAGDPRSAWSACRYGSGRRAFRPASGRGRRARRGRRNTSRSASRRQSRARCRGDDVHRAGAGRQFPVLTAAPLGCGLVKETTPITSWRIGQRFFSTSMCEAGAPGFFRANTFAITSPARARASPSNTMKREGASLPWSGTRCADRQDGRARPRTGGPLVSPVSSSGVFFGVRSAGHEMSLQGVRAPTDGDTTRPVKAQFRPIVRVRRPIAPASRPAASPRRPASSSASSSGITVWPSLPSRRIETVRSAASFLPTTSSAGTLASECSRTL